MGQIFLPVEPVKLPMIDGMTFASQQDMKPPVSEPSMFAAKSGRRVIAVFIATAIAQETAQAAST
ncbi:MAG: hypothetical protein RIR97_631 [Pseudomonadota bacterium]